MYATIREADINDNVSDEGSNDEAININIHDNFASYLRSQKLSQRYIIKNITVMISIYFAKL